MKEPFHVQLEYAGLVAGSCAMAAILLNRFTRIATEGTRLAQELDAARHVQESLVPSMSKQAEQYHLEGVYLPANEVGGDFYWDRVGPDGSVIVVAGDVSGKGLKAAMLVSVVIGILRNERSTEPSNVLEALNGSLAGHTDGGSITCCCARFEPKGLVRVANAGHISPWLDGQEVALEPGLPLGVVADAHWETATVTMALGSVMTVVSDGVVEAAVSFGELFGFDRTRQISGKTAPEIAETARAWGQNDDITVVTVRRTG